MGWIHCEFHIQLCLLKNKWVVANLFGCKFAHCVATLGLVRIIYPTEHIKQTQCTAYIHNSMCTHLGVLIRNNTNTVTWVFVSYILLDGCMINVLVSFVTASHSTFTSSMTMKLHPWTDTTIGHAGKLHGCNLLLIMYRF